MKKVLYLLVLLNLILFVACGQKEENVTKVKRTYLSEAGEIEVPENPQRIVVLNGAISGSVISLKGNIVGIDKWSRMNPLYEPFLKDVTEVSDENLEQIIELNPDLIITASSDKNIEKLKQIAPTVSYTYGKVDYLTQIMEIGKLINKEKEAKEWETSYKAKVSDLGAKIKEKYGENFTVTVLESFDKQLYIFGKNFARGTEILYTELNLKMNTTAEEKVKNGYYAISPEVLGEYAGDFIIFSKNPDADNTFQNTEVYKNLEAVKNNRVFEVNAKQFYFSDPITLDYTVKFLEENFLK